MDIKKDGLYTMADREFAKFALLLYGIGIEGTIYKSKNNMMKPVIKRLTHNWKSTLETINGMPNSKKGLQRQTLVLERELKSFILGEFSNYDRGTKTLIVKELNNINVKIPGVNDYRYSHVLTNNGEVKLECSYKNAHANKSFEMTLYKNGTASEKGMDIGIARWEAGDFGETYIQPEMEGFFMLNGENLYDIDSSKMARCREKLPDGY